MLMQMLRSFELRLKPKAAQRSAMQYILADSAETYNAALQERPQGITHEVLWKAVEQGNRRRSQQNQRRRYCHE